MSVLVEVRPNGQVFVNGTLVAEVILDEVVTRDDLIRSLTLDRTAQVVYERLTELTRYALNGKANGNPARPTKAEVQDRVDFGVAFLAGLAGEPGELTGRPFYRDGHRAGTTLRALRDHLGAELGEVAHTLEGDGR